MKPHFLGFISYKDFVISIFGNPKLYKMNHILPLTLICTSFVAFFEQWIWSPAWSLIPFSIAFFVDFFAAIAVSMKTKRKLEEKDHKHPLLDDEGFFEDLREGFSTMKAMRAMVSWMAIMTILVLLFQLEKIIESSNSSELFFVFSKMSILFYFYCFLMNLISIAKHFSTLGILRKDAASFFIKYIDTHKNIISTPPKKEKNHADTIH